MTELEYLIITHPHCTHDRLRITTHILLPQYNYKEQLKIFFICSPHSHLVFYSCTISTLCKNIALTYLFTFNSHLILFLQITRFYYIPLIILSKTHPLLDSSGRLLKTLFSEFLHIGNCCSMPFMVESQFCRI